MMVGPTKKQYTYMPPILLEEMLLTDETLI